MKAEDVTTTLEMALNASGSVEEAFSVKMATLGSGDGEAIKAPLG